MSVFFNSERKSSEMAERIRKWFDGVKVEKVVLYTGGKSSRGWDEASVLTSFHSVSIADSPDRNGMIDIVLGWSGGMFKYSFYVEDVDEKSLENNNFDHPILNVNNEGGLSCSFMGR